LLQQRFNVSCGEKTVARVLLCVVYGVHDYEVVPRPLLHLSRRLGRICNACQHGTRFGDTGVDGSEFCRIDS